VACTDSTDPIAPSGRFVVFYKYLRVNRYGDGAVIRGCNNVDSLLAKNANGIWIKTAVNIALDVRVNPALQKACRVSDITSSDDKVRPENASVDATNLKLCEQL